MISKISQIQLYLLLRWHSKSFSEVLICLSSTDWIQILHNFSTYRYIQVVLFWIIHYIVHRPRPSQNAGFIECVLNIGTSKSGVQTMSKSFHGFFPLHKKSPQTYRAGGTKKMGPKGQTLSTVNNKHMNLRCYFDYERF